MRLKFLVPRFRIENYGRQKTDRGEFIIYQAPEALRKEGEAIRKKSNESQLKLGFPLQCEALLEGKISLKSEGVSAFWETIERLSLLTAEDEEFAIGRPEDGVCGGIAVLFALHRDWLKANPKVAKRCIDEITKINRQPPPPGRFAHSDEITPDWQTFSARVVPILWSENLFDPVWRELAARLATSYKYKVVEMLFATAGNLRTRLGESFVGLQDFVCDWAVARWQWRYEESSHQNDAAANWITKEVGEFAAATRKLKASPWQGLHVAQIESDPVRNKQPLKASAARRLVSRIKRLFDRVRRHSPKVPARIPPTLPERRRKLSRNRLNFDPGTVKSAYAWLPELANAVDDRERQNWLAFWTTALSWCVEMIPGEIDEDDQIEGLPTDWDRWLFDRVSKVILQLNSSAHRDAFWKPVLRLPAAAHYWVEDFLQHWLMAGLGAEPVPPEFRSEWRRMIEFALNAQNWSKDPQARNLRDDRWKVLMGLESTLLWAPDHRSLLAGMKDLFEQWAKTHLTDYDAIIAFCRFLENPAAADLVVSGICWLDGAHYRLDRPYSVTRHVSDAIASMLAVAWSKNADGIRADAKSISAYKSLLRQLSEIQNPTALELSDRLALR